MNHQPREFSETDLMAYVDGQLDPARHAEVEAHLGAHPEAAAEVAAWQRQNQAMRALYAAGPEQPLPKRLEPRRIAESLARPMPGWRALAAAAVVLVALGVGGGWLLRGAALPPVDSSSQLLIEAALTAHTLYTNEGRHAVEVAGADQPHLTTWLSKRLDRQIDAPDLSAQGFQLIGGRLLPADIYAAAGPAAQLMYENAAAERVTVYVTAGLKVPGDAYLAEVQDGLGAYYWADDRITCTVIGGLPEDEMKLVAKQVFQQLSRRADGAA